MESTNATVTNKPDAEGEDNKPPVVTQPLPSEPSKAESNTNKPAPTELESTNVTVTNKRMQGNTDQDSKQDAEGEDNKPPVVTQPLPSEPSKAESSTNKPVEDKGAKSPNQNQQDQERHLRL
jgi:hypothetical protein